MRNEVEFEEAHVAEVAERVWTLPGATGTEVDIGRSNLWFTMFAMVALAIQVTHRFGPKRARVLMMQAMHADKETAKWFFIAHDECTSAPPLSQDADQLLWHAGWSMTDHIR